MSRYTELRQKNEQLEATLRQQTFEAFFASDEMKCKISPAMKMQMLPLMEFMAKTESFEFSAPDPEDEKKTVMVKAAPVELFKEFCREHLPDIITTEEIATKKKAGGPKPGMTSVREIQEVADKAVEFQQSEQKSGRVITITEAVNHVTQKQF